jgi:telomere resolvase
MASKWLEERLERLLPVLASLGQEQEEQIKRLCEEELQAWRERPSLQGKYSLGKPITETRNRLRETLQLIDTNCWINPKSGAREHLSLKYLNLSSQEWTQMNTPSEEELHQRQAHPLPLRNVPVLLSKVEQLLKTKAWPELVVGAGLATGRGVVEVLHTGYFTLQSAYIVRFSGPMTVYERMCDPFEVPTLVHADLVLEALQRLREFFEGHFDGMSRGNISRECSDAVQDAIYRHWLGSIPLRSEEQNIYRQLAHGVYPRLATYLYCPSEEDEIRYMATIQQNRKILESSNEAERLALALAAGYRDYVILDGSGNVDPQRGIRLRKANVEIISVFQNKMKEAFVGEEERLEQTGSNPENELFGGDDGGDQPHNRLHEPRDAASPESSEEERFPKSIQSSQEQEDLLEEEEDWEDMQERLLDEFANRAEEAIRQERADLAKKITADESMCLFRLDRVFYRRLEAIGKQEGTSTCDATISLLLDGYEWLHRGGALPPFRPRVFAVGIREPRAFLPYMCMIRQTTQDRLVAMRPVEGVVAERHLVMAVARLLDTYEWLMEGGLVEKIFGSSSGVWIQVDPQLKTCLDEIGEEQNTINVEDTLTTLIWAYGWLYRSGLFEQLKTLASTLVSSFDLDEYDQEKIRDTLVDEETEDRFALIQELLLSHVKRIEAKKETTENTASGKGDEAPLQEEERKAVPLAILQDVPGWWNVPAWWQRRAFEQPDVLVEKARTLLTSSQWDDLVVGLTVTTGRCLTEVLKTGVVSPQSAYVLRFAAYSQQGNGMEASFEIPTLVESSLVLQAWQQVRKLNDCRALSAQEVCKRYRSFVLQSATRHFADLVPHDDKTIDRYTPLLRLVYARIAASYYCPPNKVTEQFLEYVQHGTWSSQSRSGAYGCSACWQSTYHYEISNDKGDVDGCTGLKLQQEGVELLEICQDEDEE